MAAIKLAAHVAREPSFPASEFEQLKKLMITSLESQLSDPDARASKAMAQHFNTYPKGDPRYSYTMQERLDGIKAVTLDDVKRFHKTFYAANNALFAVVGDFDEAEVTKAIRESFGSWRNNTPYKRITREYRAIPGGEVSIETPDKENATLLARMNLDSNQADPDYAALYLADYMFGGGAGFDSRLTARIRVKEGLSYSVGSSAGGGIFDRYGSWSMQAIAAPQNIAKAEAALREEIARAVKDGFTDEEIAKAKSGLVPQFAQNRVQDQRLVGRLLAHLDNGRTFLTWDKEFERRMLAVTPEQVRAVLKKYLDPSRSSTSSRRGISGRPALRSTARPVKSSTEARLQGSSAQFRLRRRDMRGMARVDLAVIPVLAASRVPRMAGTDPRAGRAMHRYRCAAPAYRRAAVAKACRSSAAAGACGSVRSTAGPREWYPGEPASAARASHRPR